MVVILSDRKNGFERTMKNKLLKLGGDFISDGKITEGGHIFTGIILNKPSKILLKKGIIILSDNIKNFKKQDIPKGVIGVCREGNFNGLALLERNGIPTISCGTGSKNTLTVSSLNDNDIMVCLQRSITDINGNIVEPCEIKAQNKIKNDFYATLAAVAVKLIYGIKDDFVI